MTPPTPPAPDQGPTQEELQAFWDAAPTSASLPSAKSPLTYPTPPAAAGPVPSDADLLALCDLLDRESREADERNRGSYRTTMPVQTATVRTLTAASRLAADLAARLEAVKEDNRIVVAGRQRLAEEWAVMARACGNWREWPTGLVNYTAPDYMHPDWQTAARAILERDSLLAARDAAVADGKRAQADVERMTENFRRISADLDVAKARVKELERAALLAGAGEGPK